MKAPDKIYIQTNKGEAFSSKWTTIPFRDFENTEYIRKDTLMEFVNKKLQESADRLDFHANQAYAELIDKLNEM